MRYLLSTVFGIMLLGSVNSRLQAWTSAEVFAKYSNDYFIETGSYLGDGMEMALARG